MPSSHLLQHRPNDCNDTRTCQFERRCCEVKDECKGSVKTLEVSSHASDQTKHDNTTFLLEPREAMLTMSMHNRSFLARDKPAIKTILDLIVAGSTA